ncbi:MAG: tetratricopeptide repeat protein [Planctomycetes bacterium]|nr:tetratricopeptide repeat protein [Planctomycetota bacterium]MCL4731296.1 tetratricopeptide repeat protein [Planctomycetota bacterium]
MLRTAVVLVCLLLISVLHDGHPSAQAADPEARKREVIDRVHRARRLREFGYPLLARAQLDLAKKLDPNSREMLLEYVRLFTRADQPPPVQETLVYVGALIELFPEDFESCLEIGHFLFQTAQPPAPPQTRRPETVQAALERLDAEMKVYAELGRFMAKPEGDLPPAARGRPQLSLAFLARCAKANADSAEVKFLAAQELFFRGTTFQGWSLADPALAPFGKAALELFDLAEPLYRGCAGSDEYAAPAALRLVDLLLRASRFGQARQQLVAARTLNPGSLEAANLQGDIAEQTQDIELLVDALRRRLEIFQDSIRDLDLRAARRIQSNQWPFARWREYVQLDLLGPQERQRAVEALLQAQSGFVELHFHHAVGCLLFARASDQPSDTRRWLEQALTSLERCRELAADFADWHRRRGLALWLLGRYEEAAAAYEQTAKLSPSDNLSRAYASAGRDIAAGLYTAADYERYRELQEPGDFADKRKALLEILRRAPRFFAALAALAEVAQVLGDFELAFEAGNRALELSPAHAGLLDSTAQAALRTERYADATKLYERLVAAQPKLHEPRRQLSLAQDMAKAGEARRKAFQLWLQAQRPVESETGKRKKLEEALTLDPTLCEALIDMAVLERRSNPVRAERLLESSLRHNRDEFTKMAAHRERGKLFAGAGAYAKAVGEFESAYAAFKGDGSDLLLAALAHTQVGSHADASAAMRKLFAEVPDSPVMRPGAATLNRLGLAPAKGTAPRRLGPGYGSGDKAAFVVELSTEGEGGGQIARRLSLQFEASVEVAATPDNGGLWRLKVSFGKPPTAEFAALEQLNVELQVSPWFGLVNDPVVAALQEVVHPVLQAIVEAFTCGMGDAPVVAPWVWRNTLTKGPPHFGSDDADEASAVTEAAGDSLEIRRHAVAGREIDSGEEAGQTELTYRRGLRAVTRLAGARRAVLECGFEIAIKELTRERDDVKSSRLTVRLVAR